MNFDQLIDRRNTNSKKWERVLEYDVPDLLPFWIADMDLKAPQEVTEALQAYLAHGIYGYSLPSDGLREAVCDWQKQQHHYQVAKDEILFFSGVLAALTTAIQAFTEPGDGVMIHDPVYPPFASIVTNNQRQLFRSSLKTVAGRFVMDLEGMEKTFQSGAVKVFILCNPHNPGGRVWEQEELANFGELCKKYDVLVLSDEIHQDLALFGHRTTTFQNAGDFAEHSVIFTAATKTFNLAGLKNSMVFVKNPLLKEKLQQKQDQNFQGEINTFGQIGTEAAYREGLPWLNALKPYLENNIRWAINELTAKTKIKVMEPEGTFLLWLDFSAYGLSDEVLADKLIYEAKVFLNSGIAYGPGGHQHMRFNIACPYTLLQEGVGRIVAVFGGQ